MAPKLTAIVAILLMVCYTSVAARAKRSKRALFYPNTNYCGKGDRAWYPGELGSLRSVDSCCHIHDQCDDYILPGKTKWGITNEYPYTIMSCDCDNKLRQCLSDVDTDHSNCVGKMFFVTVTHCVDITLWWGKLVAHKPFSGTTYHGCNTAANVYANWEKIKNKIAHWVNPANWFNSWKF